MLMLTEICRTVNNWFVDATGVQAGVYSVIDGQLTPPVNLLDGQYYAIFGGVFNEGVHQIGNEEDILKDEPQFEGTIFPMRIPADFLALVDDIKAWQEKNGAVDSANMSPFQSESYGIYNYSMGSSGGSNGSGASISWKDQFKSRLNAYRKIGVPHVIRRTT